jgi:hypothetical protein
LGAQTLVHAPGIIEDKGAAIDVFRRFREMHARLDDYVRSRFKVLGKRSESPDWPIG